jgi:lactate dehydrogenase-like 2-hydroxyacid dehydrogenase
MRKRVYVTRSLPGPVYERLRKYSVEINEEDRPPSEDELIEKIRNKHGIISLLTDPISRRVIDAARNLKIIANYAVGYDNIDVEYATRKGIMVTNTPGVLTDATAELAWALLFAVSRRIVEADSFTREGKFKGWSPTLLLGTEISGKTIGIVGAGRIGTAFGLKSKGFNVNLLYFDNRENQVLEKEVNAKRVCLNKLLKESDFISLHLPLTPETYHIIGKKEIKMMKKSTYLINTSRGPIIDENALMEGLESGEIKGAGLDVYEKEPLIPERMKRFPNIVLLPHIGSATEEARVKMALLAVENLVKGLEGETPPNLVRVLTSS